MKSFFLFNLFCYLSIVFGAPKNPFSIKRSGILFQSNYTETNQLTIISLDKFDFSINIGRKVIDKFEVTHKDDILKVKIYPNLFNPSLKESQKLTKIAALCAFSYPLTVVASGDSYQCSLTFKDKSGNHHSIGSCKLSLIYKSTFCSVEGILGTDSLRDSRQVALTATIYQCNSLCARESDLNWKKVVNSTLILTLVSWNDIIWLRTAAIIAPNNMILMGVPRNPINKSTTFGIPFKLRKGENDRHLVSFILQVTHDKSSSVEDVISTGCFSVSDPKSFEDGTFFVTEIETYIDETVQRATCNSEQLFILQMSVKEDSRNLSIAVSVENVVFKNDTVKNGPLPEKVKDVTFTNVSLFSGRYHIIPMIQNPIILPNFDKLNNPYELQESELKIFYIYADTKPADVSSKILCRPFDSTMLRCPPSMQALTTVFTTIDDLVSLKWSLELMIEETLMVVTVEPLMRPESDWIVKFSDSVLNLIPGWMGIQRSEGQTLPIHSKCVPIYQVVPIQIYKRIVVNSEETSQSFVTDIDMSSHIDSHNIRLSKDTSHVYKSGSSLVIQGISRGNLDVELVTNDNRALQRSNLFVYSGEVSVVDLDVSCISNISVSKKAVFSSSPIEISNFHIRFSNSSLSHSCYMSVDVVFSDGSRTNIFSFPPDQYSLKIITDTKIIDITDIDSMWYDYRSFNGATSFEVHLEGSKFCDKQRTVFRKRVTLNISAPHSTTTVATKITTVVQSKSSSKLAEVMVKKVKTEARLDYTFFYVSVGIVVLVIIIICIICIMICYCKKKNCFARDTCKSKSRNGCSNNSSSAPGYIYPPLLPPPGPQVELSDASTVTISSPHSFWCNDQRKIKTPTRDGNFIRQNSLPVKGSSSRDGTDVAHWNPFRWVNKMIPSSSINNSYTSQDGLNCVNTLEMCPCSPMTWSSTHKDVDDSSGVGSFSTNVEDLIKDPYGSRERFHKLSELAYSNTNNKEHVYEMV